VQLFRATEDAYTGFRSPTPDRRAPRITQTGTTAAKSWRLSKRPGLGKFGQEIDEYDERVMDQRSLGRIDYGRIYNEADVFAAGGKEWGVHEDGPGRPAITVMYVGEGSVQATLVSE
jgi:hypothetical protein